MSDETHVWDPDGILPDHLHRSFAVLVEDDYGRPRADFRVMAYTPILWTGWECDYGVVLIEIDGERKTVVLAGVAYPGDSGPAELLRERLQAYQQAIADTEHFLAALEVDGSAGTRFGRGDFLRDPR